MITIDNMNQHSASEVFTHVARHLLKQGTKSACDSAREDRAPRCLYRAPGGLMCAAGCLIPDQKYNSDIEDTCWLDLVNSGYAPVDHSDLICQLQNVHDSYAAVDWRWKLQIISDELGLNVTVADIDLGDK